MITERNMYIGGEWVGAESGRTRTIQNPSDGTTIAEVAEGGRADARSAIRSARDAFDQGPWPHTSASERAEILRSLGRLIERDSETLASLETSDTGKTIEESRWDMADVAGIFAYYAALAEGSAEEVIASPIPHSTSITVREPIGACGQILPWNYPLLQASWKLAPALATGCTIVMKPSELTPLTTIHLTRLAEELSLPPGVLNLVLGPGASVGAELAESDEIDFLSFTGGISTGKSIMRAASGNVKRVALELGGKNPNIIFSDADFDAALEGILNGALYHAGQICSAGSRVMVEVSLHDRLVDALADRMERIVLGDGFDPNTQMGPLISAEHREKVENYIALATEEGACIRVGGARPSDPKLQQGSFYLPTLITGCKNQMRIAQEEIFGPVITIETFETETEAIENANSTVYGLSAGFWTHDADRIARMSRALRFGTVWVNEFNVYFAQAPWGGFKQSGIGRELGRAGLEEYTEIKHVFRNHAAAPMKWFGK